MRSGSKCRRGLRGTAWLLSAGAAELKLQLELAGVCGICCSLSLPCPQHRGPSRRHPGPHLQSGNNRENHYVSTM